VEVTRPVLLLRPAYSGDGIGGARRLNKRIVRLWLIFRFRNMSLTVEATYEDGVLKPKQPCVAIFSTKSRNSGCLKRQGFVSEPSHIDTRLDECGPPPDDVGGRSSWTARIALDGSRIQAELLMLGLGSLEIALKG
jgi:hypothetical protein